jgi:hypothetical protein
LLKSLIRDFSAPMIPWGPYCEIGELLGDVLGAVLVAGAVPAVVGPVPVVFGVVLGAVVTGAVLGVVVEGAVLAFVVLGLEGLVAGPVVLLLAAGLVAGDVVTGPPCSATWWWRWCACVVGAVGVDCEPDGAAWLSAPNRSLKNDCRSEAKLDFELLVVGAVDAVLVVGAVVPVVVVGAVLVVVDGAVVLVAGEVVLGVVLEGLLVLGEGVLGVVAGVAVALPRACAAAAVSAASNAVKSAPLLPESGPIELARPVPVVAPCGAVEVELGAVVEGAVEVSVSTARSLRPRVAG